MYHSKENIPDGPRVNIFVRIIYIIKTKILITIKTKYIVVNASTQKSKHAQKWIQHSILFNSRYDLSIQGPGGSMVDGKNSAGGVKMWLLSN